MRHIEGDGIGITTDAPRLRSRMVSVQYIGQHYPVLENVDNLTVIELVPFRPTDELDALATRLYGIEGDAALFQCAFTTEELTRLAKLCTSPGRAYDDEVFDALAASEKS